MKIPPTNAKKEGCIELSIYFPRNIPIGEDSENNPTIIIGISFFFFLLNRNAPNTNEIGILCTKIPNRYESKNPCP